MFKHRHVFQLFSQLPTIFTDAHRTNVHQQKKQQYVYAYMHIHIYIYIYIYIYKNIHKHFRVLHRIHINL